MSRKSSFGPPSARWAWLATVATILVFASTIAAHSAAAAPDDPADSAGQVTIPDDANTPVIDRAGVIDGTTRRQLFDWLLELRQKTHAEVKVLTVPSLRGEDVYSFAQRHGILWKLGEKGEDNGVLIVLALKEHKVRIQVGRGLEGALPDSWCGTVSRQAARQYFSHGQYSQGLAQLVLAVAQRIAADAGVKLTGVAQPLQLGSDSDSQGTMVFIVVFFIMIIAVIVIGQMQRRQQGRWGRHTSGWGQNNFPYIPGGFGGFGGGGGSSGGWSSGGGGGFGGGGGDFAGGGGGASW